MTKGGQSVPHSRGGLSDKEHHMHVPHPRTRRRTATVLLSGLALAAGSAVVGPVATATTPAAPQTASTAKPGKPKGSAVMKRVSKEKTVNHLFALESIARKHGSRASGTPGYTASRNYVVRKLKNYGYTPKVQAFDFPFFQTTAPTVMERTAPTPTTWVDNEDFALMTFSGSGDVTAPVQGVDLNLGDLENSTSGCEAGDFTGFTAGNIALVRRGTCDFMTKAANAEAAGAAGVVVMNQGTDGRTDAFGGTLGDTGVGVPVVGTSFAIGEELNANGTELRLSASTVSETRTTYNVIARVKGRNTKNTVMSGAHLDGVIDGHGINDNGSGSAALLESARVVSKQLKLNKKRKAKKPKNGLVFAWWGAEELGLLGAEHWVADEAENHAKRFRALAAYLNFDMVGSTNYALMVYDGDNSTYGEDDGAMVGPKGSGAIEKLFHSAFKKQGSKSDETAFSGRSDYGPFIEYGVPAGGLFTGAEGVKTPKQANWFGGTAGEAYDPCYHATCDNLGNISRKAVHLNTRSMVQVIWGLAKSTKPVNGHGNGHTPPAPQKSTTARRGGDGSLAQGPLKAHDDHRAVR